MSKIYVILYVPLIGEKYEVMIPVSKPIHSITSLLVKAINELSSGAYPLDREPLLYKKKNGQAYDVNITIKESDIRHGSEIILV